MSDKSKIEWTDATWNPVTGCTKVSEGCRNCYAKTFTERFEGTSGHYFESGFKVTLRPERLNQPLRWKRPRRIFVNSMSDLFHPDVPFDYIDRVFNIMGGAGWHTFQILTKRPERMKEFIYWRFDKWKDPFDDNQVPYVFPNIWLGVSVENQKAADERIPLLLQTPAAVRFLSCEPLLGPVDLNSISLADGMYWDALDKSEASDASLEGDCDAVIDWVIAGGESGFKARSADPDWFRSLRDQCQKASVPFLFKQWGEWLPVSQGAEPVSIHDCAIGKTETYLDDQFVKVGKKVAGRLLDGRTWDEFPEVRQ